MIDCHCHINKIENTDKVLREAEKRKMKLINSALSVEDSEISFQISERYPFFYVCVGLHPNDLDKFSDENIKEFFDYIRQNKKNIIAIGEVGLDFYRTKEKEKQDRQKKVFRKIIHLANELKLPLVIHSRDSMREALEILKEEGSKKVMLHCFSGNSSELKIALELGYYISFATNICWTKKHIPLIKETPLEKMFLETDSPWLDPDSDFEKYKKQLNNRPWKIGKSAEKISELKKISKEKILQKTHENAVRFFGLN